MQEGILGSLYLQEGFVRFTVLYLIFYFTYTRKNFKVHSTYNKEF